MTRRILNLPDFSKAAKAVRDVLEGRPIGIASEEALALKRLHEQLNQLAMETEEVLPVGSFKLNGEFVNALVSVSPTRCTVCQSALTGPIQQH